eukprot:2281861-Pleurochrysis_carterae.AAC.1
MLQNSRALLLTVGNHTASQTIGAGRGDLQKLQLCPTLFAFRRVTPSGSSINCIQAPQTASGTSSVGLAMTADTQTTCSPAGSPARCASPPQRISFEI